MPNLITIFSSVVAQDGRYQEMDDRAEHRPKEDSRIGGVPISCGVTYLYGLNDSPETIVHRAMQQRKVNDRAVKEAFIIWSDVDGSMGSRLAQYIQGRPDLGPVLETEARRNPNSGNLIKVWVWQVNWPDISDRSLPKDGYLRVYMGGRFNSHVAAGDVYSQTVYQGGGYRIEP